MTKLVLGVAVVGLIGASAYAAMEHRAAPQEEKFTKIQEFMKPKLGHAQRILEGLATENFTTILESSTVLMTLSDAASWQVVPGLEYSKNTSDFQRAVTRLQDAARKKNIDGATLAYINMTTSCINCHKAIRHPELEQQPIKKK